MNKCCYFIVAVVQMKKSLLVILFIEKLLKTLTLSITKVNLDSELISTNKNWVLKKMANQ